MFNRIEKLGGTPWTREHPTYEDLNTSFEDAITYVGQLATTAPSSPAEGQLYYNTVDKEVYLYNGTNWRRLSDNITEAWNAVSYLVEDPGTATKLNEFNVNPVSIDTIYYRGGVGGSGAGAVRFRVVFTDDTFEDTATLSLGFQHLSSTWGEAVKSISISSSKKVKRVEIWQDTVGSPPRDTWLVEIRGRRRT